jgi:predicted nucleotidyltransferase
MNVKITEKQFTEALKFEISRYLFGSRLHGIANEDSDSDYLVILHNSFYDEFETLAKYLPNIHSFQLDDIKNNTQYVLMTERQFYNNLYTGDGNMNADIVLLSGKFENPLFLCSGYKTIKGYLGVAKRDIKLHGNDPKKLFHAHRSLFMANKLINGELPTIEDIVKLKDGELPSKEDLISKQDTLRVKINKMLDDGEITLYPNFIENKELLKIMAKSNNIKQFKY